MPIASLDSLTHFSISCVDLINLTSIQGLHYLLCTSADVPKPVTLPAITYYNSRFAKTHSTIVSMDITKNGVVNTS